MPASPPPVIRVSHLRKAFAGHAVVHDVSFEVAAGETLVLLGPSGCGKTTLLKMLNRLVEPDGGSIEINGENVLTQRPEALRRGIGYVIQQVGLLPHYTVAQNVAVVPRLLGHAPATIAARTTELLARLHLPPERYAGQLPAQLSGGQQQRVGLARALAADPPIVLLDEPFGALDPLTRAGIRREFRELEELRRKTVVLVTHDVAEAFELADRILLLEGGRVQQLGTPRELLFRPANDFVRRFFATERLALQLRTLTLGDVFGAREQFGPSKDEMDLSKGQLALANDELGHVKGQFDFVEDGLSFVKGKLGSAQDELSIAKDKLGLAKNELTIAQDELSLVQDELSLAQDKQSIAQDELSLAKDKLSLAQGELVLAKDESGFAQDKLGLLREMFGPGGASSAGPDTRLSAQTTVHEALEALTGATTTAHPFTVAQLMAAFGEALQREEAAWKR